MTIEDLISQIKKAAEKEIEMLKKEHNLDIQKIDKGAERRIAEKKKQLDSELEKEKKERIVRYSEEKEFLLRMEKLAFKEKLINKILAKTKDNLKKLFFEDKRKIYEKKIDEIKNLVNEKFTAFAPKGKINEVKNLLDKSGLGNVIVLEKDLGFEDGFILEGEKLLFELTLEGIFEELAVKEKGYFSSLLFK